MHKPRIPRPQRAFALHRGHRLDRHAAYTGGLGHLDDEATRDAWTRFGSGLVLSVSAHRYAERP